MQWPPSPIAVGIRHYPGQVKITVSVIIPIKNRRACLLDALGGLAAQTYSDGFEVIVVDNQSRDDIRGTVESFAATAPMPVRYHLMDEDRGPTPARNQGAAMARGRFLAYTDSDCRPHPEWLERAVAAFDDGVGLVTGPVLYKPEQKRGLMSKVTAQTFVEHPTYPTANALYLREAFERLGGFNPALCFKDPFDRAVECADSDLAWRIKKAGYRNRFVADAIVYHEIENLSFVQWMIEPSRLFVVPLLVKLHPEIRSRMLIWNLFLWRNCIWMYVIVIAGLPLFWSIPETLWLALASPFAAAAITSRSANPAKILITTGHLVLRGTRVLFMSLALIYGSIRFRSLVL